MPKKIIPLNHALSALVEADKITASSATFKKSSLDDFFTSFCTTVPKWMFKQLNFVYLSEAKLSKVYHEGPDRTFKNLVTSILDHKNTDPVTYFFGKIVLTPIGLHFKINNLDRKKAVIEGAFNTVFDPLKVKVELIDDEQQNLFIRFTK